MNMYTGTKRQVLTQIGLLDDKSLPVKGIEVSKRLKELSAR